MNAAPPDNGLSFVEEIGNLLHASEGNPINTCIQCGTCSATCPVASGGFMDQFTAPDHCPDPGGLQRAGAGRQHLLVLRVLLPVHGEMSPGH